MCCPTHRPTVKVKQVSYKKSMLFSKKKNSIRRGKREKRRSPNTIKTFCAQYTIHSPRIGFSTATIPSQELFTKGYEFLTLRMNILYEGFDMLLCFHYTTL